MFSMELVQGDPKERLRSHGLLNPSCSVSRPLRIGWIHRHTYQSCDSAAKLVAKYGRIHDIKFSHACGIHPVH